MMETVRVDDDRQKPKIWCDGTYLFHVDVDRDPMRDATGRPIVKVSIMHILVWNGCHNNVNTFLSAR